jgi:hypothetical protein
VREGDGMGRLDGWENGKKKKSERDEATEQARSEEGKAEGWVSQWEGVDVRPNPRAVRRGQDFATGGKRGHVPRGITGPGILGAGVGMGGG